MCTWDTEHVTEAGENDMRLEGELDGLINECGVSDADWAAGAVNEFDGIGEGFIDAVFEEAVCLSAADFHEDPAA